MSDYGQKRTFTGALYITSHYMKTMVPLRICEIGSNILFVGNLSFCESRPEPMPLPETDIQL
jgi:hypothetical protein